MKLHIPCENVIIRNCCLSRGHGGLVIGSEMSGGIKNVTVTQCLMDHTDRGLRVKTRRGRGKYAVIDGLAFRNVVMDGVLTPFVINMFYFCDPDGHTDYVQTHELSRGRYDPTLGKLEMEHIVATDASMPAAGSAVCRSSPLRRDDAGCEDQLCTRCTPRAAAMMCGAGASCKVGIHAENVRKIALHNVEITGYEASACS